MNPRLRLLLLCLSALLCPCAFAATLNVGPGQPYTTIQSAIDAANPGDTVLVAPGTYYENIDFLGKAITVTSSAGPATTIIDGGARIGAATVNFLSGETLASVISNFTIRNGQLSYTGIPTNEGGKPGGGVLAYSSAPSILIRRRSRRLPTLLATILAALALLSGAGCSGKYPASTAPGSYTIPIIAIGTSTHRTHTLNIPFTVTE